MESVSSKISPKKRRVYDEDEDDSQFDPDASMDESIAESSILDSSVVSSSVYCSSRYENICEEFVIYNNNIVSVEALLQIHQIPPEYLKMHPIIAIPVKRRENKRLKASLDKASLDSIQSHTEATGMTNAEVICKPSRKDVHYCLGLRNPINSDISSKYGLCDEHKACFPFEHEAKSSKVHFHGTLIESQFYCTFCCVWMCHPSSSHCNAYVHHLIFRKKGIVQCSGPPAFPLKPRKNAESKRTARSEATQARYSSELSEVNDVNVSSQTDVEDILNTSGDIDPVSLEQLNIDG
jgi:hypothetical protein